MMFLFDNHYGLRTYEIGGKGWASKAQQILIPPPIQWAILWRECPFLEGTDKNFPPPYEGRGGWLWSSALSLFLVSLSHYVNELIPWLLDG